MMRHLSVDELRSIQNSPDNFTFESPAEPVNERSEQESPSVTLTGMDTAAVMTLSGGTTTVDGEVVWLPSIVLPNSTISAKHFAADSPGAEKTTTVTIGDSVATFTSVTKDPYAIPC